MKIIAESSIGRETALELLEALGRDEEFNATFDYYVATDEEGEDWLFIGGYEKPEANITELSALW